jgi:hypothetical protein
MKILLFDALHRVDGGESRRRGTVHVDRLDVYRHWLEHDDTVHFEGSNGCDVGGFPNQYVDFDDDGVAKALDNHGREYEFRIMVRVEDWPLPTVNGLVPYNAFLRTCELIAPPPN